MNFQVEQIPLISKILAQALRDPCNCLHLIEAASCAVNFQAALCVINRRHKKPIHVCDTYSGQGARQAIALYTQSTYLINPVYNSFLNGLDTGLYRMRDFAPDNWKRNTLTSTANMSLDNSEEIGFLTQGWPVGLEELVLVSRISDDYMVEISFAQPVSSGGFSDNDIENLKQFVPLFSFAMDATAEHLLRNVSKSSSLDAQLERFANSLLTHRENEVIQLILKGHSGKSICQYLGVSMPTLKSHRKNAYQKLEVTNVQELFNRFIQWKHDKDE